MSITANWTNWLIFNCKFQLRCLCDESVFVMFRILGIGTANGWFLRMSTRVHIDQIIICLSQNCPKLERLEVQWDPDTIRYSDNSSKFIDQLRSVFYCPRRSTMNVISLQLHCSCLSMDFSWTHSRYSAISWDPAEVINKLCVNRPLACFSFWRLP
jgi:hypothetical protein